MDINQILFQILVDFVTGRGSSIGMQAAPSSIPTSGTFFRGNLVMKKNPTAIFPIPLVQDKQLSVIGERICTKYW